MALRPGNGFPPRNHCHHFLHHDLLRPDGVLADVAPESTTAKPETADGMPRLGRVFRTVPP